MGNCSNNKTTLKPGFGVFKTEKANHISNKVNTDMRELSLILILSKKLIM